MLDKKEILHMQKDLIELHKRCLVTYFAQISFKARHRKKFFRLYDIYINTKNIQQYFFRDLELFIKALVQDRLEEISDYFPKRTKKSKRKKK